MKGDVKHKESQPCTQQSKSVQDGEPRDWGANPSLPLPGCPALDTLTPSETHLKNEDSPGWCGSVAWNIVPSMHQSFVGLIPGKRSYPVFGFDA